MDPEYSSKNYDEFKAFVEDSFSSDQNRIEIVMERFDGIIGTSFPALNAILEEIITNLERYAAEEPKPKLTFTVIGERLSLHMEDVFENRDFEGVSTEIGLALCEDYLKWMSVNQRFKPEIKYLDYNKPKHNGDKFDMVMNTYVYRR